jgi:hypothetical protein
MTPHCEVPYKLKNQSPGGIPLQIQDLTACKPSKGGPGADFKHVFDQGAVRSNVTSLETKFARSKALIGA